MALSVTNLGIDGLENVEQIGTGGSSRVYRARQVDLDRVVAVKVLNPGGDQGVARRFDRERKAMGRLSLHEGIVPVYSSGVTSHGEPYLVMPYYPNGSLQDQIDAGPLEWETAVSYVDVAAETIAAAHEEGIVHLDLKPANILLTNTGAPRIADFGIARLTGAATAGTTAGTAFTPAYSAPETFLDGETGPPSDVYGLGATLWALLVGHPPFLTPGDDTNLMAVIGRVVNNQVGDLRHIAPGPICDVIEAAMTKRPTERYQTASEFSRALKEAAASVSPNFSPPVDAGAGTALFPAPVTSRQPAGTTQPPSGGEPTLHHPAPDTVAAGAAAGDAAAPRTLLQETAQPLPKPVDGPPAVTPTPFIDLDRFRLGPLLLGLLAFVVVVGTAVWAFGRDGDNTDAGPGTEEVGEDPASPSVDAGTSLPTSGQASSTTDSTTGQSTSSSSVETTTATSAASTTSTTEASSSTTESSTTSTTEQESSTTTTDETTTSSSSTSTTSTTSTTTTTTLVDPVGPPTDLEATVGNDDTSVRLEWAAPASGPDPVGYRLLRNGTVLRDDLAANRRTFTDRSLAPGTYTYSVRALGEGDQVSPGVSATVTVGPLAITSFTVSRTEPERVSVSFSANKCVSYRISAVSGGEDPSPAIGPDGGGCTDSTSVILSPLEADTDYQINLTVIDGDDRVTDFKTAPAPPGE